MTGVNELCRWVLFGSILFRSRFSLGVQLRRVTSPCFFSFFGHVQSAFPRAGSSSSHVLTKYLSTLWISVGRLGAANVAPFRVTSCVVSALGEAQGGPRHHRGPRPCSRRVARGVYGRTQKGTYFVSSIGSFSCRAAQFESFVHQSQTGFNIFFGEQMCCPNLRSRDLVKKVSNRSLLKEFSSYLGKL